MGKQVSSAVAFRISVYWSDDEEHGEKRQVVIEIKTSFIREKTKGVQSLFLIKDTIRNTALINAISPTSRFDMLVK